MITHSPGQLHTRDKKRLLLSITCSCLLLLLIVGGVLFQVNPLIRQRILCPWCEIANPPDTTIYAISHTGQPSTSPVTQTFLYAINGQSGQAKYVANLQKTGSIHYQMINHGVSYEIFDNTIRFEPNTIIQATHISDGRALWSQSLGRFTFGSAIANATTLYVYGEVQTNSPASLHSITAINLQNGREVWHFDLQSDAQMILDKDTLYVQQDSDSKSGVAEQFFALNANNGTELWSHPLNGFSSSNVSVPVADNGHVFFVSSVDKPHYLIDEFDGKTGALLWKKPFDMTTITDFHVSHHCIFIENSQGDYGYPQLLVLRDSDKSAIWTSSLQTSLFTQHSNVKWTYTDNIVYSLSNEIDFRTFQTNLVLRAWQINTGKKLFQVNVGLTGGANIFRIQNQLILSSTSQTGTNTPNPLPYNDIEARQAQTGALLWHSHLRHLPPYSTQPNFTFVDQGKMQSDDNGVNAYYRPEIGESDSSILYIQESGNDAPFLYALNRQNGHTIWQIKTDALNTDPHLHPMLEYPTPTDNSYPEGITSGPDGNLWFTELGNPGEIGRRNLDGSITEFPLPPSGSNPNDITAGPDGNLWFIEANYTKTDNMIVRITLKGALTEFILPPQTTLPFNHPAHIVTGRDDNLWFTEPGTNEIVRMTTAGALTYYPLTSTGSGVDDITSDRDGNLWFTEPPVGQIGRLTLPHTSTVSDHTHITVVPAMAPTPSTTPNAPNFAAYVGTWMRHTYHLTIRADGTGSDSDNIGPCSLYFQPPLPLMILAHRCVSSTRLSNSRQLLQASLVPTLLSGIPNGMGVRFLMASFLLLICRKPVNPMGRSNS